MEDIPGGGYVRDDTITVRGPFEVPDIYVEAYEDEDDGWIEAHTVDMSRQRRLTVESRACPCGRLHGYTVVLGWDMILGYPQFAEHAITELIRSLQQSMQDCQAVDAIAREAT